MREIVFGLLGGTLIGATGIGSGSLLTPLLILAGYRPTVAVSTGLATLIVSKLAGSLAHRSQGNWPGRQGWFVVGGGILGVAVVSLIAHAGLSPSELFIRRAVAVSLFVTTVAVWLRTPKRDNAAVAPKADAAESTHADPRALFVTGAIVGGFVTLTSAGSGSLLVPLLLTVTAWGVPQLAATSNLFGWVVALLSFALHIGQRSFDPHLFLLVLAGLVPGVLAGVFLSPWIERRSFAPALSLFTLYLAVQLI
jgi:uncharacterized membrane protein YfcA